MIALTAASDALILGSAPPALKFAAALILAGLLPAFLAVRLLLPRPRDLLEALALALGAAYAGMIILGLALHYLPGPLTGPLIVIGADCLILCLLGASLFAPRRWPPPSIPGRALAAASLVIAVGAFFCLIDLSYSEFQGDEAIVMLKARAVVAGEDHALFVHKKGPAEILVPAMFSAAGARIDEGTARLPFALAALAGLLAVYQLGRSMFGLGAGLIAGLLLAVSGFFIAFARIVQYQSLVLLMSALALMCFHRFSEGGRWARRYLTLGILFMGIGLLAHYDALFVVPALTYLVFRRWRSDPSVTRKDLLAGGVAACITAALLASFYIPMAIHPYFQESTASYLGKRVGEGFLHNTLHNSFVLATFYNSTYYFLFLVLAFLAGAMQQLFSLPHRWKAALLGTFFLLGFVVVLVLPEWLRVGPLDLTFFFLIAFAGYLVGLRAPSPAWKACWLWGAVPFVVYATLVSSPHTHFSVASPGSILVGSVALAGLWPRLRLWWRPVILAAFAGLYALFAWYVHLALIRHDVEYLHAYPEGQHPVYWTAYDRLPSSGWFGFPHRAGWEAVGALYADGTLRGDYDSNEELSVTHWYTRGAPRCPQSPRYYFLAEAVQDEYSIPMDELQARYAQVGRITVAGRPRLVIYERAPAAELGTFATEDYNRRGADPFNPSIPYGSPLTYVQHRMDVDLAGGIRLLGYSLDHPWLEPGSVLDLTLCWEALQPPGQAYQVFVHLESDGELVAQADHTPGLCHVTEPTSTWRPGRVVTDRFLLSLGEDAPEGTCDLTVGMYDWQTLQRLEVLGPDGQPQGNQIVLMSLPIQGGR